MAENPKLIVAWDLLRPPEEIIVDLINNDNGTSLLPGELTYGIPTAITARRHNTTVVVIATPGSTLTGSTKLTYNRINLADVPGDLPTHFEVDDAQSIADLIPAIDAAYGIALTPNDYVDGPLPIATDTVPNEQLSFDLVANVKSLIYYNRLTLQMPRREIALSRVIPNVRISALRYAAPAQRH